MSENEGMGASNNKGINISSTQFVFIINPDTVFKSDTIKNIFDEAKLIDDFAIISPVNTDSNHPNYKASNRIFNENITYPPLNIHIMLFIKMLKGKHLLEIGTQITCLLNLHKIYKTI